MATSTKPIISLLAALLAHGGFAADGLGIHSWGGWRPNHVSRGECPELRGVPLILHWKSLEPNPGEYQFDKFLGEPLRAAHAQNLAVTAMIWVGPAAPEWIYQKGVPEVITDRDVNPLKKFIQAGGTGVYLEGGGPNARWGEAGKASNLLPVPARSKQAIGTWTCISHIVKKHPIFEGLPTNGSMWAIYGNVWAPNTLQDFPGEAIAGSIGYDWFPVFNLHMRHYYGPGDTWWGADLGIAKLGKGRCIASQLRIVNNLGKDPVADKLLFNLVNWAAANPVSD